VFCCEECPFSGSNVARSMQHIVDSQRGMAHIRWGCQRETKIKLCVIRTYAFALINCVGVYYSRRLLYNIAIRFFYWKVWTILQLSISFNNDLLNIFLKIKRQQKDISNI
jgi:hypothetical protein